MAHRSVTIRTGARLHFGPLSFRSQSGRNFGGIGMMTAFGACDLQVSPGTWQSIHALPSEMQEMLNRLFQSRPDLKQPIEVMIRSHLPRHAGFGSGTQLALAMGESILRLQGENASVLDLAEWTGRGERSAIGIHGYESGGFLIDAGHHPGERFGRLACRVEVPDGWRAVLLIPRDQQGLHGVSEREAFRDLEPMNETVTGRLCRLALTEILPALTAADHDSFCAALSEYGTLVGEFFRPWQGGVFASPVIQDLVEELPILTDRGLAQTSWGPSAVVFAKDAHDAADLVERIGRSSHRDWLECLVTSPMNTGRSVVVAESPSPPQ